MFALPLGHVLPSGYTLESVTKSTKVGSGVEMQAVSVGADDRSVDGQIATTSATPSVYSLLAVQLVLSNGDVWEINVPVVLAE
jgi:hypothetical protein